MTRLLRPVALLLVAVAPLTTGCVRQQRFRFVPAVTACFPETMKATPVAGPKDQKPSLDCRSALYKMAFIEFDEQGRLFDPEQSKMATRLIEAEKARANGGKIITVVYIHGWKNNAAEAPPGGKPKDVEKFQGALSELGYRAADAAKKAGTAPAPVVGIYLAWRGKTLMGPSWFTFTSLWSRRNTANNIGDGPDLATVLDGVIDLTNKGSATSRVLLIGHSFGARVLEHAIESQRVRLFDRIEGDAIVRPRVDLVLYVNSANDARLGMGRVQALQASGLRVHHPDFTPEECAKPAARADLEKRAALCRDYPLLVAITSTGDSATKYLLPLADTINGDRLKPELEKQLPPLPTGDGYANPAPSAGAVRKAAAANLAFLQSHEAHEVPCPAIKPAAAEPPKPVEAQIDEAVRRAVAEALGKGEDPAARKAREAAESEKRRREEQERLYRTIHPICGAGDADCRFVFRTLGDTPTCYQVDQRQVVSVPAPLVNAEARPPIPKPPFNRTPFWIMQVDPTVVKDHGDIWNLSFVELLGQLMAPRRFFDADSPRMQLAAEPSPK
jgi:hypothetical protein